jgi:hypothetical protein
LSFSFSFLLFVYRLSCWPAPADAAAFAACDFGELRVGCESSRVAIAAAFAPDLLVEVAPVFLDICCCGLSASGLCPGHFYLSFLFFASSMIACASAQKLSKASLISSRISCILALLFFFFLSFHQLVPVMDFNFAHFSLSPFN